MALYEVIRTDDVLPGEFVSAFVLAAGTALARASVEHLEGVQPGGKNVLAVRVETKVKGLGTTLISTYEDEREAEPDDNSNWVIPDYTT